MKKKVTVLVVIYILFLLLGLWFNLQRGVADYDQFWKLKQDGWYTSPAGDRIRYSSTSGFDMILNDRSLSASLTRRSDGGYRVAFSDGWALETANFPYLAIEVGGVWLSHDLVYELTDLDAQGLALRPLWSRSNRFMMEATNKSVNLFTLSLPQERLLTTGKSFLISRRLALRKEKRLF